MEFTNKDVGCYADGGLGQDYTRSRLSDTLAEVTHGVIVKRMPLGNYEKMRGLHKSLNGPMSDDAWDEIEALEILQENTEDGLVWIMEAGDLLLISEAQLEV